MSFNIANTQALTKIEEVTELYNRVIQIPNPIVVELGCYCGYSSYVLAQAVKKNNGHLYCIDAFIEGFDGQPFTGQKAYNEWHRVMSEYMDVTTLIKSDTSEAANRFEVDSIDFLFIDADHSYNGFKKDLTTWKPFIKSNRLLALHDFNNEYFPGIKQAFYELANWPEISNTWSLRIFKCP